VTKRETVKRALFEVLDSMDANGGLTPQGFAELGSVIAALREVSPVPDPIVQQDRVHGRWETLFSHFGSRESAGKTRVHESDLRTHTFGQFKPLPIRVTRLCQEIARGGVAYNNVSTFEAVDGSFRGNIVIRGCYRPDPGGDLRRFVVDFTAAELHPAQAADAAVLRERLGLAADQLLQRSFKSPKLHSDIVYLDDDTRVNVGAYGGVYVLRRTAEPGVSIALN
jgi:hypothetical protein